MYNERILPWFKENVADALFLKKQANVRWISGFKGADTCVMVTANGGFLITDPRYTEQAEIEAPDFTLVNWRAVGGSVIKALASIVKENNIKSLAFESDVLSFGEYSELRKSCAASRHRRRSSISATPAKYRAGPSGAYLTI